MKQPTSIAARVWLTLCVLTVVSVSVVEGAASWHFTATTLVVAIAALKSRLVILHYMEAARAARHWRFLYEVWNLTVASMVLIGYLMGAGSLG